MYEKKVKKQILRRYTSQNDTCASTRRLIQKNSAVLGKIHQKERTGAGSLG